MKGEKVFSIMNDFQQYYLDDYDLFIQRTRPTIVSRHKDPEGFILHGDEHRFLKIKTRAFIDAFTQDQHFKIAMFPSSLLAMYPFFRKRMEFGEKYLHIMTIATPDTITTSTDFEKLYREHGLEICWSSPLNKKYSMGILNYHTGNSRVLKTTLEYIACSNPSKLETLVPQIIKTNRYSFFHEPERWKDLWFRSCELL